MAMDEALIRTDESQLELAHVLTASSPGLAPFTIESCCSEPVTVVLSSSLEEQISFQLKNRNLEDDDLEDQDPADWNQLFNEVSTPPAISARPASPPHATCVRTNKRPPPDADPL